MHVVQFSAPWVGLIPLLSGLVCSADEPPAPRLPVRDLAALPVAQITVDLGKDQGPLEAWRHTLGHGGVNSLPLPDRVVAGTARLHPRLVRIFIQEFFQIYPDHGRFDWSRLDPYMDALARTGAKVVAAITIKPKPLYPEIKERVWKPNDVAEWQRVIAALVKRYSVERPIVSHWEIGNETDIGENGGCPFLIENPADYAEFYKLTIEPIVQTFPAAKVGGCAVAGADSDYLPRFIEICRRGEIRLDFISWHLYSDDPAHHARLVTRYRSLLEGFGAHRPELMVTEWSKGFEPVSIEESAFAPRRAAAIAACLIAMVDAGVDWTFYYHLWDQVCDVGAFAPFFEKPEIMYHHWNEMPHRFGLFGVGQEVRPHYFVFQMLGGLGDRRVAGHSDVDDVRVLAARRARGASVLVANYGRPASQDRVATIRFAGLKPGLRRLTVRRVDRSVAWPARSLELTPVEERDVDVLERFSCQVYCPADSVCTVLLEEPGLEER